MNISTQLSIPAKLRFQNFLRKASRQPALFAKELAQADEAARLAENPTYRLVVDSKGVPRALKRDNNEVTVPEMERFHRYLQGVKDPAERRLMNANLNAVQHLGFQATIDAKGRLTAKRIPKCERHVVDLAKANREHRDFNRKLSGASAFL